jgi:hypothetical protein
VATIIIQKGFYRGSYSVVFVRGDGVDSTLKDFDSIPDAINYARVEAKKRNIRAITNKIYNYEADLSKVK